MSKARLALRGGTAVVPASEHVRWPVLGADDKAAVLGVLERGVLSGPFAPEVRALEQEFAQYIGTRHCLTTNSGTAAIHMALAGAGVGPGDEVITPAFSFVATPMAVLHHNAIPVFVDIEADTFGMDPHAIEAAITPRTRCIMPVHMHGMPCEIEAIGAIAKKHGLVLIEDAAQAHGATYKGKRVGTFGAAAAFSLQSSKNLSCGEGGLFVTDDETILHNANRLRMFGEDVKPSDAGSYRIDRALDADRAYDSMSVGWMYRTNEMSAALTRSQLTHLDAQNARAVRHAETLNRALSQLPGVTPPHFPADRVSCVHKYRIKLDATQMGVEASPKRVRDAVVRALRAEGVDAVLWQTQPLAGQTIFREKIGFGKGWPWSQCAPVNYDLAQWPTTVKLLDSSIVLFSQTFPIGPQPDTLVEKYLEAFEKVWTQLPDVLAATDG